MAADRPTIRDDVRPGDERAVGEIVESTGFFRPDEVAVAVELVTDRLARGAASDYRFIFLDNETGVIGYACYGPIACTIGSYDLYWIALHADRRGSGLGKMLLREAENRIAAAGGRRVYIETSSQPKYEPTRRFYERCGYRVEARLESFYDRGDDKLIYVRVLAD